MDKRPANASDLFRGCFVCARARACVCVCVCVCMCVCVCVCVCVLDMRHTRARARPQPPAPHHASHVERRPPRKHGSTPDAAARSARYDVDGSQLADAGTAPHGRSEALLSALALEAAAHPRTVYTHIHTHIQPHPHPRTHTNSLSPRACARARRRARHGWGRRHEPDICRPSVRPSEFAAATRRPRFRPAQRPPPESRSFRFLPPALFRCAAPFAAAFRSLDFAFSQRRHRSRDRSTPFASVRSRACACARERP